MNLIRLVLAILLLASPAAAQAKRPLKADDIYNVRDVRDPHRSPDGKWVAYTLSTAVKDTDKNNTDVWMVSWDGSQQIQVTSTPEGESSPRWSPDGKYLSFVSSRMGAKGGQVWLLNRAGGEAMKLTDVKGGVSDYGWAPDSKRLVLVIQDPDPSEKDDDDKDDKKDDKKTPRPIVIDRYHFKADGSGFLRGERSHLHLFDIESKKADPLTPGVFDEDSPAWSPDGTQIAFVRRHGDGDVDRMPNRDLFVVEAKAGAQPRRLTMATADESGRPAWSPDGKSIAYLLGDEVKYSAYDQSKLAVVPVAGGQSRILADTLDRPVSSVSWGADGTSLVFVVVDDRAQHLARVTAAGGRVEKLIDGRRTVSNPSGGADGHFAVLASTATDLPEVHALEGGTLRKLTRQNDAWMKEVALGTTEDFTSTSKDGTVVNSVLVKPNGFDASRKYPLLLRIHGGPNGQDAHAFNFERELFAAHGYAVIAVNYRGSNGRGNAFQKAIFADWGNKEVVDLLGAMDAVQKMPWVDAGRLGIGGWSYGGILTDYTIATDTRFKAAISGAGSANQIAMYGSDMYITQYEQEIGPPWKSQDLWIKISYPFFHADRIKTPTLFMVGEKDFNVPLAGSEQMYQALRSLGIDTQLVIYPNQFHGITTPSYKVDRLQRYLDWYGKYLRLAAPPTTAGG
ncbi:MAG TPA: S9 family peptidase [Vicinamibacterales bacterium]|nr:S9 family peptidase [Vicinamibacterales bacterium]